MYSETKGSHPRIEQYLAALALVEEPIAISSLIQRHHFLDETGVLPDAAEDVLALDKHLQGEWEHSSDGTASEVKRHVLVVDVSPSERERWFLVDSNGTDDTEGADKGVSKFQRTVVAYDLRSTKLAQWKQMHVSSSTDLENGIAPSPTSPQPGKFLRFVNGSNHECT